MIQELLEKDDNLTILYVEDNIEVRESTSDILDIYFNNFAVAIDGEDGLEKYKKFYEENNCFYDIVLTDINMPKMDGIEMIREITTINNRQDIIVISAHNDSDKLVSLIDLEVTSFILKPIDIQRFENVFSKVIEIIHSKREYKQNNKNLEVKKEIAEKSTEQKSQFLANMSHEIRTPLNAIMGFITLLSEKEKDETKLKYLNIIKSSSDSLLTVINDILDFSKINSGKLTIDMNPFPSSEEIISLVKLFKAKAKEKNISFKLKYDEKIPQILISDITRIKQIISNLLSNAIKFTPNNGTVKTNISYKNGELKIIVKDKGIGISDSQKKEIFNSFTQADNSISRKYGGTGLGLSISLELAKLLGGTLSVESKEAEGSKFILIIPVDVGEESIKKKSTLANFKLDSHILLVEDYEANRMFVSILLEQSGMTYEMAEDGLEAIKRFENGSFDLILMDENMPNLNGIEATKEILNIEKRLNKKHTPIIALTANAFTGDRERFLESGMDDYLTKPIEPQLLLETISLLLKKFK